MKRIIAIFGLIVMSQSTLGQDKKIDELEILYDQGYYSKVLRKVKKLLADPEYDYSGLPSYYQSAVLFRMSDDSHWFKRNRSAIDEAIDSYHAFAEHVRYGDYVHAHYYEILSLKNHLNRLGRNLKELGYNDDADKIYNFCFEHFEGIKAEPGKHEIIQNPDLAKEDLGQRDGRENIVDYAKSLVGIKYVWAGSDETGFDCSGFISYVMKKYGISIPRTALGQMEESKKVRLADADMGDLVFFGSGAKITHVGMVVSEKDHELMMVHASTSEGVIVTNIQNSNYWSPKLKAAGTYI